MDNPVEQVGSDLADVGRKLGHAVATGASEVKDVLLGKPGPPVPQPPGFDWASTYGGLAKGDTDEYAKQYKAHEETAKTQAEFQQGQLKEQGLETQLKQLNLDKLTRESEIVKELRGLDMSKPESAGRRKELFEEYALLNGKSLTSGRPRYPTTQAQIYAASKVKWDRDLNEMPDVLWPAFDQFVEEFLTAGRTSTTSGIDRETQLPYSSTSTSRKAIGGKQDTVNPASSFPPPPSSLGGAAHSKPSETTPKVDNPRQVKYGWSPNIETAYNDLLAGGKVSPKMEIAARRWARETGQRIPHVANKNIDVQSKSVEEAEKRLSMMEGDMASPSGPNDVDLLWNHLGMTAAGQKGVRVTKNIIEEAVKARPISQSWGVEWHKLADGTFLSPQQRRQFVELAKRRTESERQELEKAKKDFGGDQDQSASAPTSAIEDIPGFIPTH